MGTNSSLLVTWHPHPSAITPPTPTPTQYICYCGKSANAHTFKKAFKLWVLHWEKKHIGQ